MIDIRVADTRFDPMAELGWFDRITGGDGAIVTFLGKVRPEGGSVQSLHLDHHPEWTERSMRRIADAAARHWALGSLLVIHRVGDIAPDEAIILVAVAARHRREAFEACDFVVDHMKSRALLWKRETGPSGSRWIDPRTSDIDDIARWGDKALNMEDMFV